MSEATPISQHEGKKYLRRIVEANTAPGNLKRSVEVDVYSIIKAFGITCPARQHALKKILMPGMRGKGTVIQDLKGAIAALNRAIELEEESNEEKTEAVERR
jgi:hypothetical protein